jgi:glycosyltransferase involved in cell wall biosynthesis
MRVLVISSSAIPTPPPEYSGLERVVASFCKYAGEKGHEITLISSKGSGWSEKAPKGVEVIETVDPTWQDEAQHFMVYKDLLVQEYTNNDDTIVFDNTWLGYSYLVPIQLKKKCNIVKVHHGMLGFSKPPPVMYPRFCGISRAHALHLSTTLGIPTRYVWNGIELPEWKPDDIKDEGYLVSLNRITKEKGILECIDAARQAKIPIKILGDN